MVFFKIFSRAFPVIALAFVILVFTGCGLGKPRWATYEEITTDAISQHVHSTASSDEAIPASRTPGSVRWTAPSGWREETGAGMRLASFGIDKAGATGLCAIVQLSGAAGGLEANVRRWFGQLNLDLPEGDDWASFLERQQEIQSVGGFAGTLVDLIAISPLPPETPSMLAALLNAGSSTLFVKFTGPRVLLEAEKEAFTGLCRSLRADP